jgi:flagellar biosynthesis protein FlhG
VGKTCFAVNTAVAVARRGWRVVLVDADFGCANVEVVLGMRAASRLDDFFDPVAPRRLAAIISGTPYANLRLVPGTSGLSGAARPRFEQKAAFMRELCELDADLVIVDLDAGAQLGTLDLFLLSATHGIVIITPERTSIDNAFKFLRGALYRRIERFYQSPEVGILLKQSESLPAFVERLENAQELAQGARDQLRAEMMALARAFRPRIVVNRVTTAYEAQIAAGILSRQVRQHLLMTPDTLGHIYFDRAVSEAVNSGVPFVAGNPNRRVSLCIMDIANRLGYF